MRTPTAKQEAALASPERQTLIRVLVEDGDGEMRDVTDLFGRDFFDGLDVDARVDDPIGGATLQLMRAVDGISLSPLVEGSQANRDDADEYAPLVFPVRRVVVEFALLLPGEEVENEDWTVLGEFEADRPRFSHDPISIDCRDPLAALHDTWIEEQRTYGDNDTPEPIQEVMQEILDDNGLSAFELRTIGDPDFGIREYELANVTVLEALKALADLIGWSLHWRWDPTADPPAFALTFYEPDRDASGVDWTVSPDDYYDVTDLAIDTDGIRNAGVLLYTDAAGELQSVDAEDSVSIELYRRRFILLDFRQSQIRTEPVAQALIDSVIADLSTPPAVQQVECAFLPFVELGDVIQFEANGDHYDTDQDLAVWGYRHSVTPEGVPVTIIEAGGKPKGGWARWHEREGRDPRRPVTSKPPTASVTHESGDRADPQETVRFDGSLGDGGTGPLTFRYRVIDTTGTSAWSSPAALSEGGDTQAIDRAGAYQRTVVLEVTDADGLTGTASYIVTSILEGTGDDGIPTKIRRGVEEVLDGEDVIGDEDSITRLTDRTADNISPTAGREYVHPDYIDGSRRPNRLRRASDDLDADDVIEDGDSITRLIGRTLENISDGGGRAAVDDGYVDESNRPTRLRRASDDLDAGDIVEDGDSIDRLSDVGDLAKKDEVTDEDINVAVLSSISTNIGEVQEGHIRNPGNTAAIRLSGEVALPASNFIDFTATSTDPILKFPGVEVLANGDATFSGIVAAESFTGTDPEFLNTLRVRGDHLTVFHPGDPIEAGANWSLLQKWGLEFHFQRGPSDAAKVEVDWLVTANGLFMTMDSEDAGLPDFEIDLNGGEFRLLADLFRIGPATPQTDPLIRLQQNVGTYSPAPDATHAIEIDIAGTTYNLLLSTTAPVYP